MCANVGLYLTAPPEQRFNQSHKDSLTRMAHALAGFLTPKR